MDARWAGLLHWADLLLILVVLWVVYLIREPRRKAAERKAERDELERWSAELARDQTLYSPPDPPPFGTYYRRR